ncbi:3-ketoacyl-CoA thiolase @ Acetyl-CoA acetyltransferase [hydrothermal vent metagenome]|uniref:acetyl-CoA C-acetyltransferase n=1 Tax=hydrothermal vent metagenome TaxID=652676 RepID=A0A3B1CG47_9ZZZZ
MRKVVIVSAKRTPIGSFMGKLSSLKVTDLGKIAIQALLDENKDNNIKIDEVIMGNVLPAGVGQAPARQAALYAGLPDETECLTINKMCGSGLKAVMLADQAIKCNDADTIIAGGMESMSNAPYLLPGARNGYRLGNAKVIDSMVNDGLWDIYNNIHMGSCAEKCARDFEFSREELDNFAIESYNRTIKAQENHIFDDEIVPVKIVERRKEFTVKEDEEPGNVKFEKIPQLRPAFEKDGVITAANASKINDGAAALLVMSEQKALEFGLKPLVEIVAQASAALAPIDFPLAPANAIKNAIAKTNLELKDINLFEINEAFAVVSLAVNKLLELDPAKVNINGGAIALGHPIGASGARILATLIHQMKRDSLEYGLASLCIGGGEGSALIVKNYN